MKKIKQLKLSPSSFFVVATIVTVITSFILSLLDVQTTGYTVQVVTNEIESYVIAVESLLSVDAIKYTFSNLMKNFLSFAPVGTIIIASIGIGVARRTEFLKTLLTVISNKFSKKSLTFLVILLSIICSIYINAAYVILLPIAAILFIINGRHPLIGVIASFAGIAGGYGITVMVGSLDSSLSAYTSIAARLLDPEYGVTIWSNIFMMALGTLLMAYVGTQVTERMIVPRIGKLNIDDDEMFVVDEKAKKGLRYSMLIAVLASLTLLYCVTPGLPFSGILLDTTASNYVNQLLGSGSPFYQSGTILISFIFLLTGIVYGKVTGTLRKEGNAIKGSINDVADILIVLFFASIFISVFKQSNIGPFITAFFTNLIVELNFSGLSLIFLLLFVVMISNLVLTSPISKWAIISPMVVPIFMQSNISPEFTQMIFRIGQSTTNGITPMLAYFVIFIAFVERYNTNQNQKITVSRCISYTLPYSIAFALMWILLMVSVYIVGLPIGINAFPTL